MRTTYVTVILSVQNTQDTEDQTDPLPNLRCLRCGKLLARARGRILVVANTRSPGPSEVPVGVPMIELKCPSCNSVFGIVWQ